MTKVDKNAAELWHHAPTVMETLNSIAGKSREEASAELSTLLGLGTTSDESRPTVEDFEFALQAAVLGRLETDQADQVAEVANLLDATAYLVAEIFERAAAPGAPNSEAEKCKVWWNMFVAAAEETARLVPVSALERLVDDFENSLVKLRNSYLKFAKQRLAEFDAKQEADAKAEAEAEGGEIKPVTMKEVAKASKEGKDKETKRIEERKKVIMQLNMSPNGTLYLMLTSLLKQVTTRLYGTQHSLLRARVALMLERLLAMDHKALANNQKLRTQDFVQLEDLDKETESCLPNASTTAAAATTGTATSAATAASTGSTEAAAANGDGEGASSTSQAPKSTPSTSLGGDALVDHELYKSFWAFQEYLQYPERMFDKPENWSSFRQLVVKLLKQFEKYPTKDDAKQPWAPQEPSPLRQAPRSRAFGVQLDDPGFRQQFLTQILIAFQALEVELSSRRGESGGLIARQGDTVGKEFRSLKETVEAALGQIRKNYPALLKHVLDREAHWATWKANGCREYQRESLEMLNGKIPPADQLEENSAGNKAQKPRLPPHVNTLLNSLKDPQWSVLPPTSDDPAAAKQAMRQNQLGEMCNKYLERITEDEKPENGIEEEYQCKKNKVFMWQCRRLFNSQHLRVWPQQVAASKKGDSSSSNFNFLEIIRLVQLGPSAGKAPNEALEEPTAGGDEGEDEPVANDAAVGESAAVVDADAPATGEGEEAPAEEAPDEVLDGPEAEAGVEEPDAEGEGAEIGAEVVDEPEALAEATTAGSLEEPPHIIPEKRQASAAPEGSASKKPKR